MDAQNLPDRQAAREALEAVRELRGKLDALSHAAQAWKQSERLSALSVADPLRRELAGAAEVLRELAWPRVKR